MDSVFCHMRNVVNWMGQTNTKTNKGNWYMVNKTLQAHPPVESSAENNSNTVNGIQDISTPTLDSSASLSISFCSTLDTLSSADPCSSSALLSASSLCCSSASTVGRASAFFSDCCSFWSANSSFSWSCRIFSSFYIYIWETSIHHLLCEILIILSLKQIK